MTSSVDFLANNGTVGGGEVMLLSMATMAAELGLRARVVAPSRPGEVIERAKAAGLAHLSVEAQDRRSYLVNLARHGVVSTVTSGGATG